MMAYKIENQTSKLANILFYEFDHSEPSRQVKFHGVCHLNHTYNISRFR